MKTKTNGNFAAWLRAARQTKGWTQAELAIALGYAAPTNISDWERGARRPPPPARIQEIARVLDAAEPAAVSSTRLSDDDVPVAPRLIPCRPCHNCDVAGPCADDVQNHLPAWCEIVHVNDVVLAQAAGQLPALALRYRGSGFDLHAALSQEVTYEHERI